MCIPVIPGVPCIPVVRNWASLTECDHMVALEGNSSYHYARQRLLLTYLAVVVKPTHHYDCQSGGDIDIAPLMLSPSILANLCRHWGARGPI